MVDSLGYGGKESIGICHYGMKRNYRRFDESEVLDQTVGSIGFFSC